jgi:hypothetical protein
VIFLFKWEFTLPLKESEVESMRLERTDFINSCIKSNNFIKAITFSLWPTELWPVNQYKRRDEKIREIEDTLLKEDLSFKQTKPLVIELICRLNNFENRYHSPSKKQVRTKS